MTIPSKPMITHTVDTPNEKQNLPCFSPVFTTSPNITTTLQQNNKNTPTTTTTTTTPFEPRDLLQDLTPPSKHALSFPWHPKQPETENENPKTEQIYVHPLVKRASSSLSPKSLEMCTESIGSETGNDIIENLDEFYNQYALEKQSSCKKNKEESQKKIKKPTNFPPPLSSISGNGGVQVQTHREDGRLVIKAFSFSCCRNYFQAERENGRLKLSFVRVNSRDDSENHDELAESEEQKEEGEEEKDYCDGECDEEDDFNGGYWGENNVRDDGGKIGCKINGGDWSGGGRCNGDMSSRPKRLPSLPFCVAIS